MLKTKYLKFFFFLPLALICVGYFKLHDKGVRTEGGKQDRPRTTRVRFPCLFSYAVKAEVCGVFSECCAVP